MPLVDVDVSADGKNFSRRRSWTWVWWLVFLGVGLGLGVLFGWWTFRPPAVIEDAGEFATVTVQEVEVGLSVPMAVTATWHEASFGTGAAEGTLTSVLVSSGDTVEEGAALYTVDLRPVMAAQGEVPSFRDLSQGLAGTDVAQLQEFLIGQGFLEGGADGDFGASTDAAVRAWQRSIGVEVTGIVLAGDLVFTPKLPARVLLGSEVNVGDRVGPDTSVLMVAEGTPTFTISGDPTTINTSLPVELTLGDHTVLAVVSGSSQGSGGDVRLTLGGIDGAEICAEGCESIPFTREPTVVPARQVLVETVSGPGVPAAALWLRPDGSPYVVINSDGSEVSVEVLGQGQGLVVIEGVGVGTVVRVASQVPVSTSGGAPGGSALSKDSQS